MRAKKQRNGLREHSLPSFAANINQFRAHLPPLYDVSFLRDATVRYRMCAIDLSKDTSHFYRRITSRRRFSISFMCSCDSENYHFTNDEI